MQFDLPTVMAMESFVIACSGMMLLVAWLQNKEETAIGLWGVANLFCASGILSLMLGMTMRQPAWIILAGSLLVLEPASMLRAARSFDAKPTPLFLTFLGPVIMGIASFVPGLRGITGSLGLTFGALCFLAVAVTLWLGRRDQLAARRPLIFLSVVHAAVLLVGTYSTLNGATGQDQIPPIMSLFGFIHFESIIYSLGTAVFVLALVKERNEAASLRAACIDPLTGILNRGGLFEKGGRVVERCRLESAPVSVMMFDLDRFKAINDTYGHNTGDAVIRKFCQIAAAALRPNDVFGRIGGEEFAAILPGLDIEAAWARAERIRSSFAENCRSVANHKVDATVSCGLSVSANGEHTLSALFEKSDVALYRAKDEGRNGIKRADQSRTAGKASNVIRVA
jgi:diguanylate cyclase (GGDEF)-like protein